MRIGGLICTFRNILSNVLYVGPCGSSSARNPCCLGMNQAWQFLHTQWKCTVLTSTVYIYIKYCKQVFSLTSFTGYLDWPLPPLHLPTFVWCKTREVGKPRARETKKQHASKSVHSACLITSTFLHPAFVITLSVHLGGHELEYRKESLHLGAPCWRLGHWRGLHIVLIQFKPMEKWVMGAPLQYSWDW